MSGEKKTDLLDKLIETHTRRLRIRQLSEVMKQIKRDEVVIKPEERPSHPPQHDQS